MDLFDYPAALREQSERASEPERERESETAERESVRVSDCVSGAGWSECVSVACATLEGHIAVVS